MPTESAPDHVTPQQSFLETHEHPLTLQNVEGQMAALHAKIEQETAHLHAQAQQWQPSQPTAPGGSSWCG